MKPGSTTPSKSWLVLETLEQPLNFTRHYLMPSQIEKRWRKREWSSQKLKGTRLHIFKDHVFVSKRVKRYDQLTLKVSITISKHVLGVR